MNEPAACRGRRRRGPPSLAAVSIGVALAGVLASPLGAATLGFEPPEYSVDENRPDLDVTLRVDAPECGGSTVAIPEAAVTIEATTGCAHPRATPGGDFDPLTVVVPIGGAGDRVIRKQILGLIRDDDADEETEYLCLHLGVPAGTVVTCGGSSFPLVAGGVAAVAIKDDDSPLPVEISIEDASAAEGEPAVFRLRLSEPPRREVRVHFSTRDGSAQAGLDYRPADRVLVIVAPGRLVSEVSVATLLDEIEEEPERFLAVIEAEGASVRDGQAVGTIEDRSAACTGPPETRLQREGGRERRFWPGAPPPEPIVLTVLAVDCDDRAARGRTVTWGVEEGEAIVERSTITGDGGTASTRVTLRATSDRATIVACLDNTTSCVDFVVEVRGKSEPPPPGECDDRSALTAAGREHCRQVGPWDSAPVPDAILTSLDATLDAVQRRIVTGLVGQGDAEGSLDAWAAGGGGSKHQEETDRRPGLEYEFEAVSVGLDVSLPWSEPEDAESGAEQRVSVGAALGFARGRGDLGPDGGAMENDDLSLTGYALFERWRPGNRRVHNRYGYGMLGYGPTRSRVERVIRLDGEAPLVARGRPDGTVLGAALGGGVDALVGRFTIGGFAGVRYERVDLGRYRETGAGDLDLIVHPQTADAWSADVGVGLRCDSIALALPLSTDLRIDYTRELSAGSRRIVGEFAGEPGNTIAETVGPRDEDAFSVDLLLLLRVSRRFHVHLSYEMEIDREDERSEALQLGVLVRLGRERRTP